MQESISADNKIIEERKLHKQQALLLLGSLEAEDDVYKAQQKKITVISQQESAQNQTKGADTMKKHCYKRTDGRWQYLRQQAGMRYYAIASTYRELLEKIPTIKPKQIKNIKHSYKKTNQNTFIQYYQYYIDSFVKTKKISKTVKNDWQRNLDKDIAPNFQYVKLEDLTSEMIQSFINQIPMERKQQFIWQRIVKVLNTAYATGRMKRNITLALQRPKRKDVKEIPVLTFHDQIQMLKHLKNTNLYAFAVFSLIVGTRREETMRFNLTTDIDERKLLIHIRGTKTSNADRYVHVTKQFVHFLKQNMQSPTFNFDKDTPSKRIGSLLKSLGVKNGCLHSLRHTCSANLYFLGANDKYRQMQLGHASIVTTNDIYTNIKENTPKRWLRQLYGDLYPSFD